MGKLPQSEKASSGHVELERVIEQCRAIEERGLNPFSLDIDSILSVIREYFPSWEKPEELSLDAETVNRLASVIRLQSEWLQRRSSSLYMDPMIIERRLKELTRDELASAFTTAWRPVLEMETLTIESIRDAVDYWNAKPLITERWPELAGDVFAPGSIGREEFMRSTLLDEVTFESRLKSLFEEFKSKAGKKPIPYWDFVSVDSFEETVERSYLASFLVSYGWAGIQVDPIQGDTSLKILPKNPATKPNNMQSSVVLAISKNDWERRRSKN